MKQVLSILSTLTLTSSTALILSGNVDIHVQQTSNKIDWNDVKKSNINYFNNLRQSQRKQKAFATNENNEISINEVINYAKQKSDQYLAEITNRNLDFNQTINFLGQENSDFKTAYENAWTKQSQSNNSVKVNSDYFSVIKTNSLVNESDLVKAFYNLGTVGWYNFEIPAKTKAEDFINFLNKNIKSRYLEYYGSFNSIEPLIKLYTNKFSIFNSSNTITDINLVNMTYTPSQEQLNKIGTVWTPPRFNMNGQSWSSLRFTIRVNYQDGSYKDLIVYDVETTITVVNNGSQPPLSQPPSSQPDIVKNPDDEKSTAVINDLTTGIETLKTETAVFKTISIAAAIAAVGFWAASWWFGISIPWAIGATIVSVATGVVALLFDTAATLFNPQLSEIKKISKITALLPELYKLAKKIYQMIFDVLIGEEAILASNVWSFPPSAIVLSIIGTIGAWIEVYH